MVQATKNGNENVENLLVTYYEDEKSPDSIHESTIIDIDELYKEHNIVYGNFRSIVTDSEGIARFN